MDNRLFFLSGLPRTGSTLLTSILSQNPNIYSEGNSALCQLMWDMRTSCRESSYEQLIASSKIHMEHELLSSIPKVYYKDTDYKIIIDKCRSWTLPDNLEVIKENINPNPKIIVMTRSVVEVMKSMVNIYLKSDQPNPQEIFIKNGTEPIMRSLYGVAWAKENDNGEFIFVSYNDLLANTKETIDRIYKFCGWAKFEHTFDNITTKYHENENIYAVKNMHEVRPTISKREIDVELSKEVLERCQELDSIYDYL